MSLVCACVCVCLSLVIHQFARLLQVLFALLVVAVGVVVATRKPDSSRHARQIEPAYADYGGNIYDDNNYGGNTYDDYSPNYYGGQETEYGTVYDYP